MTVPSSRTSSSDMRLNGWVAMFEDIYFFSQNFERDRFRVFAHLIEVVGGFAQASLRLHDYDRSKRFLTRIFAWYCALLTCLRRSDLESIVWAKFPNMCPFCTHDVCTCDPDEAEREAKTDVVRDAALRRHDEMPRTLHDWQRMFDRIYSHRERLLETDDTRVAAEDALSNAIARLAEELAEVSEAMRLEFFVPAHVPNECADVFAWICGLANVLPLAFGHDEAMFLADATWNFYPGVCHHCRNSVCTCQIEPAREAISQAGVFVSQGVDELTGVPVRDRLMFDLEHAASRGGLSSIGVVMFDCDDFKRFNDETPGGHAQGDEVLRALASVVGRAIDGRGSLYRFGGDEFIVLFDEQHVAEMRDTREAICAAVAEMTVDDVTDANTKYEVRISTGAAFGDQHKSVVELLNAADEDMYREKRDKKDGPESPSR